MYLILIFKILNGCYFKLEYLATNNQDLLDTISTSGKLDDNAKEILKNTLTDFIKTFKSLLYAASSVLFPM